jgi:diguanylate cyclase (GGDEF)-like protein
LPAGWAEELREGIQQVDIRWKGVLINRITISLGAAVYPEYGRNFEGLLRSSDQAMYQAKRAGRGRVVAAGG